MVYGTVISCNVLMHNFYRRAQDKSEKEQVYVERLEGALNQIRITFSATCTEWKIESHLWDCLFYDMNKHLRDSLQYLFAD